MLAVEGLNLRLGSFALRDVSFGVEAGAYLVLLGASGAGKTVLLETLAGLTNPDSGTIRLEGRDVTASPPRERRMVLVYQDRMLFPHMTVRDNIAYPLRAAGAARGGIESEVARLAGLTGASGILERRPEGLSGGEAQRVALARALAARPRILLLDEPVSSLDIPARADMRVLLRQLRRSGLTVIHVTHDHEEAVSLATRIGVVEDGRVTQTGPVEEVLGSPRSPFAARFTGYRNLVRGVLAGTGAGGEPGRFTADGLDCLVVTDAPPGPGHLGIRSEDVVLSAGRTDTSARNCFEATVVEAVRVSHGVEVIVDAGGVRLGAIVTPESVRRLALDPGRRVFASFKATAVRFIPD